MSTTEHELQQTSEKFADEFEVENSLFRISTNDSGELRSLPLENENDEEPVESIDVHKLKNQLFRQENQRLKKQLESLRRDNQTLSAQLALAQEEIRGLSQTVQELRVGLSFSSAALRLKGVNVVNISSPTKTEIDIPSPRKSSKSSNEASPKVVHSEETNPSKVGCCCIQ